MSDSGSDEATACPVDTPPSSQDGGQADGSDGASSVQPGPGAGLSGEAVMPKPSVVASSCKGGTLMTNPQADGSDDASSVQLVPGVEGSEVAVMPKHSVTASISIGDNFVCRAPTPAAGRGSHAQAEGEESVLNKAKPSLMVMEVRKTL